MREIVHLQTGQCGNQIGAKVSENIRSYKRDSVVVITHKRNVVLGSYI